MKKTKVGKIVISDKIYIKKEEVFNEDELVSLFTYDTGDAILQTYDETHTLYSHQIVLENYHTSLYLINEHTLLLKKTYLL